MACVPSKSVRIYERSVLFTETFNVDSAVFIVRHTFRMKIVFLLCAVVKRTARRYAIEYLFIYEGFLVAQSHWLNSRIHQAPRNV